MTEAKDQNIILFGPIDAVKAEINTILAATLHCMDHMPHESSADADKRVGMLGILEAARNCKFKDQLYRIRDTRTATLLIEALTMYDADSESRDPRTTPSLAAKMIAAEMGREDAKTSAEIERMVNQLKERVSQARKAVA